MENGHAWRYLLKYRRGALGKLARGSHQQTFLPTAPRMCLYEQVEPFSRSCRIHTHVESERRRECSVQRADNTDFFLPRSLPACCCYSISPFQIGGKVFCMLPTSLARPRLNQSHRHRDRAAAAEGGEESWNRDWLFQLLLLLLLLGTNCSLFLPSKCMEIWRRRRESP